MFGDIARSTRVGLKAAMAYEEVSSHCHELNGRGEDAVSGMSLPCIVDDNIQPSHSARGLLDKIVVARFVKQIS